MPEMYLNDSGREENLKAIILAAGRGSRMLSETDLKPKCLSLVHEKPLIEWQIEALRLAGVSDIAIVTGYKSYLLRDYSPNVFYNPIWKTTNMVKSLLEAREWLTRFNCVVSYSDIYYEKTAISSLAKSEYSLSITYDPNWIKQWESRFDDPLSDAESFRLGEDGLLCEIGGKAKDIAEIQGQYMGLLRFTPNAWIEVEKIIGSLSSIEINKLQMTHLLQLIIDSKLIQIEAIPYFGKWSEFDTQSDLIKFHSN